MFSNNILWLYPVSDMVHCPLLCIPQDLRAEIVKLCAFLEKDLTDEAIDHVATMSTFKNMKADPKANYKDLLELNRYKSETMRKGVVSPHCCVSSDQRSVVTCAELLTHPSLICVFRRNCRGLEKYVHSGPK